MTRSTRWALSVVVAGLVTVLSGCGWTGLNSLPLPFTKGHGASHVEITAELSNAANLVPNSEVRYHDVVVGSVRRIKLDEHWVAHVTLDIEGQARVPDDVTAKVAQKSLLGAEYLDLADPSNAPAAAPAAMASGAVIPLARTGRYPETEEVLESAALLFSGGGLPQIRTIAHELNAAIGGHTDDLKTFVQTVSTFTDRLATQRDDITHTLEQLDRLSRLITANRTQLSQAVQQLPAGIDLLSQERQQLVTTLQSLDTFGKVATQVIGSTKADLQKNLDNLRPVTRALAQNGKALSESFDQLGYPFNVRSANNIIYGDYLNLITEIDVNASDISKDWLGGTPLDGLFNGLGQGSPVGTAGDGGNSLAQLLQGLLGGKGPLGALFGGH